MERGGPMQTERFAICAAMLSRSASETAAKTGAGMDVDLARMPKREPGMNGVEVMTSESQERMLAIVTPENLQPVLDLCRRWEILEVWYRSPAAGSKQDERQDEHCPSHFSS